MNKYLFTSLHAERRLLIGYEDGGLRQLNIEGPMNLVDTDYLATHFPWFESELNEFERITRGKVTAIMMDLTFVAFWNAYAYKVGNKARTEKLWNTLSDVDKAAALKCIPIYDQFLMVKKNQDKVYPETYLSQRRFENNYKLY